MSAERAVLDPAVLQALDELLASYRRDDAPGLLLGLRQPGGQLLRLSRGLACVASGQTLSPASRLRIGSSTKQFCCWALLLLEAEGSVALDSDVRDLIPELPIAQGPMTVRQLMQHTAGLRCHMDLWTIATAMNSTLPDEELLALLLRQCSSNFPAGQRLIYSNGGYLLLSELVRRASGLPLGEFLRQRVFAPLGMNDTSLLPRDGQLLPGLASQHTAAPDGAWRRARMPIAFSGEGGMVSTLDDMLRWLAYLDSPEAQGRYLSMQQAAVISGEYQQTVLADYGLGLCLRHYRGQRLVGHAGAVLGGQAELLKLPDLGVDLVLLANRSDLSAPELARRVIDIVLAEHLGPAPVSAAGAVTDHVGSYRARSDGQVLRLLQQDERALIDFGGVQAPLWLGKDDRTLVFAGALGELHLHPGLLGLELHENGRSELLERLPVDWGQTEQAERWSIGLLGCYWSDELPAELSIHRDGSAFLLGIQGRFGRALYRLDALAPGLWSAHEAGGTMAYSFTLEAAPFQRDGAGTESCPDRIGSLRLSSLRTRHLLFSRVAPVERAGLLDDWCVRRCG